MNQKEDEQGQDPEGQLEDDLRAELDEALLALDELTVDDPEEALSMFDSLPEPVQALTDFQLLLARAHQALGQLEASRDLLQALLRKDPDSADAHHLMADVLEDLESSPEATTYFLRTRALDEQAYLALSDDERATFERETEAVLDRLIRDLREFESGALKTLPSEEEIKAGADPRALSNVTDDRAQDNSTQLTAYAANLYAEVGDLLDEDDFSAQLRRCLILDCASSLAWPPEEMKRLGLSDHDVSLLQ